MIFFLIHHLESGSDLETKIPANKCRICGRNVSSVGYHYCSIIRSPVLTLTYFARQLLTENIIHVCIAIMLENETNPKDEILKAVCRLISFVSI
jgi:hypothetical protein